MQKPSWTVPGLSLSSTFQVRRHRSNCQRDQRQKLKNSKNVIFNNFSKLNERQDLSAAVQIFYREWHFVDTFFMDSRSLIGAWIWQVQGKVIVILWRSGSQEDFSNETKRSTISPPFFPTFIRFSFFRFRSLLGDFYASKKTERVDLLVAEKLLMFLKLKERTR